MARQQGPDYKTGLFNGYLYYKTKYCYFIRRYTPPAVELLQGPAFKRVRTNNSCFGTASTGSKLIRNAFRPHVGALQSTDLLNRLLVVLKRSLHASMDDAAAKQGLNQSCMARLKGFCWTEHKTLPAELLCSSKVVRDGADGKFEIMVQSIEPGWLPNRLVHATHFRIEAMLAVIDFDTEEYEVVCDGTGLLDRKCATTGEFLLTGQVNFLPPNACYLLGMAVRHYEMIGERAFELIDRGAFCII